MNNCKHLDEIEDYHEGTIICKDCGLVKDSIFISQNISNIKLLTPYESNTSILSNILDKINANDISGAIKELGGKNENENDIIDLVSKELKRELRRKKLKRIMN